MEDLTGKQLGPYQVLGPLGEGGMASVYKAFQPGVERNVALKILPRHLAKDEAFVARFDREAKMVAKLQHPHILQVYTYGEEDGYTYIVMPLLKGGTLSTLLKGEPLPFDQVEKIMRQLGDALDYAHSMGIIHRDLKPSNILIDEGGNCLLTDFGIAKIVEGNDDLTKTGSIIGTPAYMSPEQGQGVPIDARSDIYSLGIILYELLTGRVPFKAETPLAVMVKHLNDPLPLPRQRNPNLPEAVERVILKTLAKRPEDRYDTAGQAAEALSLALKGVAPDETAIDYKDQAATLMSRPEPEFMPTVASTAPPSAPTARRPLGLIIAIVLVLLAVVGGGVMLFGGGEAETPTVPSATPLVIAQATEAPTVTPSPLPTNTPVPTNTPAPTNTPVPTSTGFPTLTPSPTTVIDTEFPLPDDVQQFFKAANSEQIFFQTDLDLDTLLEFYRAEFTGAGLTEREILTTLFEGGFSIVFDGAANGQAVVVQATDLGQSSPTDKRTIVIRYEDI